MWPSCRKRAGFVQQGLYSGVCAARFVQQDLYSRVGAAGCVQQDLWCRICPAEFVQQGLCSRVGDTGLSCRFVQQDLFNRLCTEVLQDLWCRICPAGLVQQDLSCRVCPPGSVLQGFYSSCPGGPALPWQQQFCSCCLCTQVPTAPAQVEVTSLLLEGWESCPVCYSPSSGM